MFALLRFAHIGVRPSLKKGRFGILNLQQMSNGETIETTTQSSSNMKTGPCQINVASQGALDEIHVYAGTAGHSAWFSEDRGDSWSHPNSHSGMYLEARVWCFASHPSAHDLLLAGTDEGVFRWSERTARWQGVSAELEDVWSIVPDPANPLTIFAGTRPAAVYKSLDGGETWKELSLPGIAKYSEINMGPTRVTQLLFDPFISTTLWATIEIGGIYRSLDGGETWRLLTYGLVSADVHGIAITRAMDGERRILASTNRGLHISDDNGETWRFSEIDSPWQYTRAVVTRTDDPSVVFLANGNGPPGNDGRLYRSRDGGDHWERITFPGSLNSTLWCIATHPSDPNLLFVCTNLGQLFRSDNGGDSWTRLPHEFGELRSLHWRAVPKGTRAATHSLTRAVLPKY
jgi:photosystem II stability/assembly factor-like uncharacterized protein